MLQSLGFYCKNKSKNRNV